MNPYEQLAAELGPTLAKYRPQPRHFGLKLTKRATAIRLAMRRLRAARRQQRLNNRGTPLLPINQKYINKKYREKYDRK